jgi:beta-ureidopropionase / N-carbamoyl-L-amino-acid hydrolase
VSFAALWESLLPIGRDRSTGGYRRYSWTAAGQSCRDWFMTAAARRGLAAEQDHNGNLWAWWDTAPRRPDARSGAPAGAVPGARAGAIAAGSHLDSVPDGGAFDGPLGVVSAFAAIDSLRARDFVPARPVAVVAFSEEEGARFGVACLGSRLLTGAIAAAAARVLRDGDGVTLAEAMAAAGARPDRLGPDDDLPRRVAAYVELHIEQGRQLAALDAVIGVGEGIWPHGRWRFDFAGRADHAGTTALADRRDPMLPFAATALAARQAAAGHGALTTFGKLSVLPGGVNAIGSAVHAWLDARAPDDGILGRLIGEITAAAGQAGAEHGVTVAVTRESFSPAVEFDPALRARAAGALARCAIKTARLRTGAGHDAGVLAARIPTAMLFVRNPSGVSHAPQEHADLADCETGVAALAAVLGELAGP